MIWIIVFLVISIVLVYFTGRNVGVNKTYKKVIDKLSYEDGAKFREDKFFATGHWIIFGLFSFWCFIISLVSILDYQNDVIKDYNNGKYEVTITEQAKVRNNDTISVDTTYYYKKIKK